MKNIYSITGVIAVTLVVQAAHATPVNVSFSGVLDRNIISGFQGDVFTYEGIFEDPLVIDGDDPQFAVAPSVAGSHSLTIGGNAFTVASEQVRINTSGESLDVQLGMRFGEGEIGLFFLAFNLDYDLFPGLSKGVSVPTDLFGVFPDVTETSPGLVPIEENAFEILIRDDIDLPASVEDGFSFSMSQVPEPTTAFLLGMSLAVIGISRRRSIR